MFIREGLGLSTPQTTSLPCVSRPTEQNEIAAPPIVDGHNLEQYSDKQSEVAPLDTATDAPAPRIWLGGEVVLEAPDTPAQGQLFASWPRSRITCHVGLEPPEDYTGITYRILKAIQDVE